MENIYKQINILNDNIKNYRVKIKKSLKIKVILSASNIMFLVIKGTCSHVLGSFSHFSQFRQMSKKSHSIEVPSFPRQVS